MSGRCEFYADALVERAKGALDGERATRLDVHLAECPDCTSSLATVLALHAAPLQPPADLEARIRSAVRQAAVPVRPLSTAGPSPRRPVATRWRPWALPLAAAAALAAIWVGVRMPGGPADGPDAWLTVYDDYDPYGAWPADGLIIAGEPLLSDLTVEELESLLQEMGS